jgi:hypothetical protein
MLNFRIVESIVNNFIHPLSSLSTGQHHYDASFCSSGSFDCPGTGAFPGIIYPGDPTTPGCRSSSEIARTVVGDSVEMTRKGDPGRLNEVASQLTDGQITAIELPPMGKGNERSKYLSSE